MLNGGFEMRYDAKSEQCGACEQSGGRCRYGRIEQHGGTEFACLCDDGANERHCGTYAIAGLLLIWSFIQYYSYIASVLDLIWNLLGEQRARLRRVGC